MECYLCHDWDSEVNAEKVDDVPGKVCAACGRALRAVSGPVKVLILGLVRRISKLEDRDLE